MGTPPATCVDLGSGNGYPGLSLAILWPQTRFTLVEARTIKAAFLSEAARRLGLSNVKVLSDRAEDLARRAGTRESFAAAIARAFAAWPVTLELALPLVAVGGRVWVAAGKAVPRTDPVQLAELGGGTVNSHTYSLPDGARLCLVEIPKVAASAPACPRAGILRRRHA